MGGKGGGGKGRPKFSVDVPWTVEWPTLDAASTRAVLDQLARDVPQPRPAWLVVGVNAVARVLERRPADVAAVVLAARVHPRQLIEHLPVLVLRAGGPPLLLPLDADARALGAAVDARSVLAAAVLATHPSPSLPAFLRARAVRVRSAPLEAIFSSLGKKEVHSDAPNSTSESPNSNANTNSRSRSDPPNARASGGSISGTSVAALAPPRVVAHGRRRGESADSAAKRAKQCVRSDPSEGGGGSSAGR